MVYKPATINLTEAQIKKAVNQQPIKLAASQIGHGSKVVLLHPSQHKLVSKAAMSGKGCVIDLSPGEILATVESDIQGTGFFGDVWKGIKTGYNWVKKNIVDTPLYQTVAKPLVRSGVNTLAGIAKTMIPGDVDDKIIDQGVNLIGNKTNAFGIKKSRARRTKKMNVLMNQPGGSFRLN